MLPFHGRTLVAQPTRPARQRSNAASADEESYLLTMYANGSGFQTQWSPAAVGGRPLLKPPGDGLDSSRVVREHEVETLDCGLVSVMVAK